MYFDVYTIVFGFIFNIVILSSNVMPICKFLQHSLTMYKYLNKEFPQGHTYPCILIFIETLCF